MKKFNRLSLISILAILFLTAALSGCGSSTSNTSPSNTVQNTQPQADNGQKTFTLEELKKYDGQNGNPAYVAVDGKVYDVTNVKSWAGGKHKGYKAGTDLSKAIKAAPHGLSVLNGLPIVGKLAGS